MVSLDHPQPYTRVGIHFSALIGYVLCIVSSTDADEHARGVQVTCSIDYHQNSSLRAGFSLCLVSPINAALHIILSEDI